jgi:dihydroneopterin aldolase
VIGVHGVLPEERTRAQPFSLDIDAWVDRTAESAVDMVEDTVDYSVLVQRAAGIVESSSFQLLESVATAIASSLLESDHRLEAVEVVVRKLRPPMPFHIASVGVRCFRRRRDADGRRADLVADRAPS